MNNSETTNVKDWNKFWDLDKTAKFSNISWSKRRIIKVIEPYIENSKILLDAGCGSGFFSQYFCESNKKTYSLDYSDKSLELTKIKTNGKSILLKKDLIESNLSEEIIERFDFIFTDGLFEHFNLTDQDIILKNLISLLNDIGIIATFVPNKWSTWELVRPFYMPGIKEKPFTLKELVHLNNRNGLQVINIGGINTLPFRFSPDKFCGNIFGMLLFTIATNK